MEKKVYKCECGFVTHFEKALQAHCRFRGHRPAGGTVNAGKPHLIGEPAPKEAEKPAEKAVKKTRKPRTKKAVANKE